VDQPANEVKRTERRLAGPSMDDRDLEHHEVNEKRILLREGQRFSHHIGQGVTTVKST
jgi:hypothetical protein